MGPMYLLPNRHAVLHGSIYPTMLLSNTSFAARDQEVQINSTLSLSTQLIRSQLSTQLIRSQDAERLKPHHLLSPTKPVLFYFLFVTLQISGWPPVSLEQEAGLLTFFSDIIFHVFPLPSLSILLRKQKVAPTELNKRNKQQLGTAL